MESLEQLDSDTLYPYLHGAVDLYLGRKPMEGVMDVLPETGHSKHKILNEVTNLLVKCAIEEKLQEEVFQPIENVADIRKEELVAQTQKLSTLAARPEVLEDFDWSLRLVMSSTKMANLREPVSVLSLRTRTLATTTERHYQMNQAQLETVLRKCEEVSLMLKL